VPENHKMEELLKVTKDGFAAVQSRFDAFGEGLLFVARKVLAEPEVRELRRILDGDPAVVKRSA
jgi:hypothetical protein